jgi:hypothetical protein
MVAHVSWLFAIAIIMLAAYILTMLSSSLPFFCRMQLLQRSGCGGYVVAQTASKKTVAVKDKNRDCPNNGNCDTVDYNKYRGRTLSHASATSFFG